MDWEAIIDIGISIKGNVNYLWHYGLSTNDLWLLPRPGYQMMLMLLWHSERQNLVLLFQPWILVIWCGILAANFTLGARTSLEFWYSGARISLEFWSSGARTSLEFWSLGARTSLEFWSSGAALTVAKTSGTLAIDLFLSRTRIEFIALWWLTKLGVRPWMFYLSGAGWSLDISIACDILLYYISDFQVFCFFLYKTENFANFIETIYHYPGCPRWNKAFFLSGEWTCHSRIMLLGFEEKWLK